MATSYWYTKTIYNNYLGTYKIIKAHTSWELEMKVSEQLSKWSEQEKSKRNKEAIQDMKIQAELMCEEASKKYNSLKNILLNSLEVNNIIIWDSLLKHEKYPPFSFNKPLPSLDSCFIELNVPKKSILETISKSIKTKRENLEHQAKQLYDSHLDKYNIEKKNEQVKWEDAKRIFEENQRLYNISINEWQTGYESGQSDAVERYFDTVLSNSHYPDNYQIVHEAQYDPINKTIIVSVILPNTDCISHTVGYKYIASTKTIKPIEMKIKEFDEFYDNLIKQTTLRTVKEVFSADYAEIVESVVFNGWVNGIDSKSGQDFTSCIISLQVSRLKYNSINLSRIDVIDCIRDLKALIAGKLSMLAPVKPLMDINREDSRFIESREVLASINGTENLATMDWADFEHLVRELFAKYFNKEGAEVKVTQSSRDGGVDAVAFDPDPIKGGKFVIQAKRYNIVVPVSAVRDLYGTMISEGAAKGILVTTSYFGNDSREFVKDKPISLLDGSNLIHMFNEFGYSVRIDLQK